MFIYTIFDFLSVKDNFCKYTNKAQNYPPNVKLF